MRRLLAAVTMLALTSALALAAPLAAPAEAAHADPIMTHQMIGSLDYVNFVPGEGFIAVGWAVNTLSPASPVYMSIKGQYPDGHSGELGQGNAGFDRPDVAAAVPGAGPNHGFRISLGFPPAGLYSICAFAWSESVGCTFATVPAENLTGQLESFAIDSSGAGLALRLKGWTSDSWLPPGGHPSTVTYNVLKTGGSGPTTGSAFSVSGLSSLDRPDIRAAHPGLKGLGGFDQLIPIGEVGDYRACAVVSPWGPSTGAGPAVLGCADLHVSAVQPSAQIRVTGDSVVGGTLTASTITWNPAPSTVTAAWYRNGTQLTPNGVRSYSPTVADVGEVLQFVETASAAGYVDGRTGAASNIVTIPGVTTSRIGGADRYEMAVANSQKQFPDAVTGAPVVYVASGVTFPDALAAGPAAAKEGGALLLTFSDHLPDSVRAEITRLHPASIVVAGGPATVADSVVADLGTLAPTTRVGGADRYEVSRNLVARAFPSGAPSVYLVTGQNYADALSAGAAAASMGAPVLLADGSAGSADDATRAALAAEKTTAVTVVGGPASVSEGVASSLGAGVAVTRLAGPDRYTGTVVLNRATFSTSDTVYLATGVNFPDGLTGGVHAGADHAPLYLVDFYCVPQDVLADIASLHATKVVLLGGETTLSSNIRDLYACS
ncbi:cell wall-binding repeat-containing protein [Herbiconiux solani]|uniref:cell wall-binding repeat-containing protein n=1 Tax=Herbiconiux solani TaxID=661329 RepID=UPI0008251A85|nr:cell wall-binding repeat-containing protein [Herbiconiux solani]